MSMRVLLVSLAALSLAAFVGRPASHETDSATRDENWRFRVSTSPLLGVESWRAPVSATGR